MIKRAAIRGGLAGIGGAAVMLVSSSILLDGPSLVALVGGAAGGALLAPIALVEFALAKRPAGPKRVILVFSLIATLAIVLLLLAQLQQAYARAFQETPDIAFALAKALEWAPKRLASHPQFALTYLALALPIGLASTVRLGPTRLSRQLFWCVGATVCISFPLLYVSEVHERYRDGVSSFVFAGIAGIGLPLFYRLSDAVSRQLGSPPDIPADEATDPTQAD